MLGQYFTSGASDLDSRIFVYEVAGLSQNEVTALSKAPLRTSHNQFFQVPFGRMNHEMKRILSLGGKIVNIRLLDAQPSSAQPSSVQPSSLENNAATAAETPSEKERLKKETSAKKT